MVIFDCALSFMPFRALICSLPVCLCLSVLPFSYAGTPDETPGRVAVIRNVGPGAEVIAEFKVEKADTPEFRLRGLSGREVMPEDRGLLFILDTGQQNFFWMKGMKFPLDILIFDREKRLIKVFSEIPPCVECPVLATPADSAYALEINAGMTKKTGIRKGDILDVR